MVSLPPLLVLTDRRQCRGPLLETVARAIDGGARAVVLREKDLPLAERERLAERMWSLLRPVDGVLITASVRLGPARGVHLAAVDPKVVAPIVGRSCHDAAELEAATNVDYVTVSPVFPTPSKPGYGPPLGLDGLARLCRRTSVKVYALGGVTVSNAAACRQAGAAGVAVMGDVMRAEDPADVVAGLLDEMGVGVP